MLEMILGSKNKPIDKLIHGDLNFGYYGTREASSFITGEQLAQQIGLVKGASVNSASGWLKFAYKGKTLYIAKKAFRENISWEDIYNVGAVYGNNTDGAYPPVEKKTQNCQVTIAGKRYIVRLMNVSDSDPSSGGVGEEFQNLFVKVFASKGGAWDKLTDEELGMHVVPTDQPSPYYFGIQTHAADLKTTCVFSATTTNLLGRIPKSATSLGTSIILTWRPVLELIP